MQKQRSCHYDGIAHLESRVKKEKLNSTSTHVDLSEKKLTGRSYEHLAPRQALLGK